MVRHHSDSTVAVGLRCRRCNGTTTVPLGGEGPDPNDFDDDFVWACPNCFTEDANGYRYTVGDTYDVEGVVVTTDDVDRADAVDTYADDGGLLTDTERGDFVAVEVEGASCADRARERGVARGTVTKTVARARRKVRGDV